MNIRHLFIALLVSAGFSAGALAQNSPTGDKNLYTRSYKVPPTFRTVLQGSGNRSTAAADPFAPNTTRGGVSERKTAKAHLEEVGVLVGEGASVVYNPSNNTLIVRNTAEQLQLVETYLDALAGSSEKQLHIVVEYIEVNHTDFNEWLLSNRLSNDGTELRKTAQAWVKSGRGTIIETVMITARSGQRAKTESIREFIYPTEFDPPEIPNEVTLSDGAEAPVTSITPTAYETRNLGTTLEVDPVIGSDGVTIDLNLAPEIVELEGDTTWPSEESDPLFKARMPTFYTQKITTQVTTQDGRYAFLGTTRPLEAADESRENPIVLQFVRADIGKLGAWSVKEGE